MENVLPCHPKDLPKLVDGTVLTLPITISVALPVEKIKFWQSDSFLLAITVSLILLLGVIAFFSYGLYHGYETLVNFHKFLKITLILNIFLISSSIILHFINNKSARYNLPNNFLANKFKWQTKPIIEIFQNHIVLYESFKGQICQIHFNEVGQFAYSQYVKGRLKPIGISFILKNHAKIAGLKYYKYQNVFQYELFVATRQFILNNSQQITAKQVVQIVEKFRKNKNGELIFYGFDDYAIV